MDRKRAYLVFDGLLVNWDLVDLLDLNVDVDVNWSLDDSLDVVDNILGFNLKELIES